MCYNKGMPILLKHIWRNIREKKLMSVLIIFSLSVSGALLFVSLSIGGILNRVAGNEFQSASTVFTLVFIVTCFMSVFVVYSSFKYVMLLRVKTVGTFRSVGASKKSARYLLLLESLAYGMISAALAVVSGIALLAILSNSLSKGQAKLTVSFVNVLWAAAFCLLLSPLCAYLPIRASEKRSVKEIILQTSAVKEKRRLPYLFAGLSLIGLGLCFMLIPAFKYQEICIVLALIAVLAGFVTAVGAIVHYAFAAASFLFPNRLAAKNLKNSRAYGNIAVLLAVAAAVVFMINSSNVILIRATDDSFKLYGYAVQIGGAGLDDGLVSEIQAEAGNAAGVYLKTNAAVKGRIPLMNLYGARDTTRREYFRFTALAAEEHGGSPIVLSSDYLARTGLKTGDKLTINETEFIISGVVREMFNSGNVGFIGEDIFQSVFGAENYSQILVKSDTPNDTADNLRAKFPDLKVATVGELLKKVKQINADLFTVLQYLIVLSTVAGVFGVLNNLLIAFNSQKKEKALLRSLGMSKRQGARSIVFEASATGLLGGILGLAGGLLLTAAIPAVMVVFEFAAVPVPVSAPAALLCAGCSAAVCVLSSLFSLAGNSRLNTVQILREEIL